MSVNSESLYFSATVAVKIRDQQFYDVTLVSYTRLYTRVVSSLLNARRPRHVWAARITAPVSYISLAYFVLVVALI